MSTQLKLVFSGAGDKNVVMIFPWAKSAATGTQVKALMQGIIANGDIYVEVPTSIISAEILQSTNTPITLV